MGFLSNSVDVIQSTMSSKLFCITRFLTVSVLFLLIWEKYKHVVKSDCLWVYHCPLLVELGIDFTQLCRFSCFKEERKHNFGKASYSLLCSLLLDIHWFSLNSFSEVDVAINYFYFLINSVLMRVSNSLLALFALVDFDYKIINTILLRCSSNKDLGIDFDRYIIDNSPNVIIEI